RFDPGVSATAVRPAAADAPALRAVRGRVAPGGHGVLVVPACPALHGTIARATGPHRRYARGEIADKLRDAGLAVEHVRYFNLLGVPGWFLNSRVLRRRRVPGLQARLHDRLVPLMRLEERFGRSPFGMSLLAVGRVSD